LYLQDWLTLKVLKSNKQPNINIKSWDKVVYEKDWKKFIATYIWYECKSDYEVNFLYKLTYNQLEKFYELDKKAKNKFQEIKSELKIIFSDLKFITWKMDYGWNTLYLFFYSDDRTDFRPFLNELRSLIWMNFFLYQVGARDSVRLNPISEDMCWDCGHKLCCTKSLCSLKSVETSTVNLQNLQSQWLDKHKWVCWKLKCCLKYEENIYKEEQKQFPDIWTELDLDGEIYTVIWINIMMKTIFTKNKEWFSKTISLDDNFTKC